MKLIQVLIAHSNPIWRYGLQELMSNDDEIHPLEGVESLPGLLAQLYSHSADVVIVEAQLPPSGGAYATQELRRRFSESPKTIMLSDSAGQVPEDALEAGVDGFLLRNATYQEFRDAVRRVYAGEALVSSSQVAELVRRFNALARAYVLHETELSDTELRILERLACGDTYEQIGSHLYLSERTVMRKVQSAVAKMDASNRTEAVASAIRRGLI